MKHALRFGIVVWLIGIAFLLAQNNSTPTEQKQEPPASSSRPTAGTAPIDVLSDTMGVDFGPYLQFVVKSIKQNWYNLIPESARFPLMKKGRVSLEFAIMKDGRVQGMTLVSGSGDIALDRAAWGGITASNPFAPLPTEFGGQYLALRITFYYNPAPGDVDVKEQGTSSGIPTSQGLPHPAIAVHIYGSTRDVQVPLGSSFLNHRCGGWTDHESCPKVECRRGRLFWYCLWHNN